MPGFLLEALSFVILFLACVMLLNVAGLVLRRLTQIFLLSFWDCLGGVVFGLFKGAAIMGFLILVAQRYLPGDSFRKYTGGSALAGPLSGVASLVIEAVERGKKSSASDAGLDQRA